MEFLEQEGLWGEQPRGVALPVTPADPGQANLASVPGGTVFWDWDLVFWKFKSNLYPSARAQQSG